MPFSPSAMQPPSLIRRKSAEKQKEPGKLPSKTLFRTSILDPVTG
jgi:hypothetical protein